MPRLWLLHHHCTIQHSRVPLLSVQTNFDARDYTGETIPPLTGKTREEVKTTLKSERIKQVGAWSYCLAGRACTSRAQSCPVGRDEAYAEE